MAGRTVKLADVGDHASLPARATRQRVGVEALEGPVFVEAQLVSVDVVGGDAEHLGYGVDHVSEAPRDQVAADAPAVKDVDELLDARRELHYTRCNDFLDLDACLRH